MPRNDLLALADEDLVALTNRGTVKRARKELDSQTLTSDIDDADDLIVTWSDGITCTFPAEKTIHDAVCSSGVDGISRHIVRSVLAYQLWAKSEKRSSATASVRPANAGDANAGDANAGDANENEAITPEPDTESPNSWDPGEISDEALTSHFRAASVTRARKQFENGVLVELTRGSKPSARFLHQHCTIRFPVPGDIRYARGDCVDSALPTWASMAVWAFRELPSDRTAGLLSLGQVVSDVPKEVLDEVLPLLNQWQFEGIANLPPVWLTKWLRLEKRVRKEGLVWPAELMTEIASQHQLYRESDARFSPLQTTRLLGELIARLRAIANPRTELPQSLVRGNLGDVATQLRQGRLVGLGLEIFPDEHQDTIAAYFQDSESGTAAVIRRTLTTDAESDPPAFERLTMYPISRSTSIATASFSQLMVAKGKRSPSDELILPRGSGNLAMNPQSFQWEQLLPPLLVDDFVACRERLEMLPPDFLRPRRLTENLQVFPIREITEVTFDSVSQLLRANVEDRRGEIARIEVPFYTRGAVAFADFQETLSKHASAACFLSGRVELFHGGLVIQPLAVVFDVQGERFAACPHSQSRDVESANTTTPTSQEADDVDPIQSFVEELQHGLADLLVTGLADADEARVHELRRAASRLGFSNVNTLLKELGNDLQQRNHDRRWKATTAHQSLRQLVLWGRIVNS